MILIPNIDIFLILTSDEFLVTKIFKIVSHYSLNCLNIAIVCLK